MAIVYEHVRNDTNEVFYVGIGVNEYRAYDIHNRNKHWKNIVNKVGYTINIIHNNIDYTDACEIEKSLISKYGRRDLGLGNLVNMTYGGEGVLGMIHSEESRQKMSEAREGDKHHMFGKTHSEETRQKMSKAKKGDKNPLFGKTHSEETRQMMSKANKGDKNPWFGKTHSEETRQMMSESQKGRAHSEETKQKVSEAGRHRKGVRGYHYNTSKNKYQASIQVARNKRIFLGYFKTEEEAAKAYQDAKLIYHS